MINLSILLVIFILSAFLGYFAVLGVTPALYSPFMSISNAISGIVIVVSAWIILGNAIQTIITNVNNFSFMLSPPMLQYDKKK